MESSIPVVISGGSVGQRRRIFPWQVFVKNEVFTVVLISLRVHKGSLIRSAGHALLQLVRACADAMLAVCLEKQKQRHESLVQFVREQPVTKCRSVIVPFGEDQ